MEQNIYTLLNKVQTDTDGYQRQELSEFEKRQWKKRAGILTKKRRPVGKAAVAAACGLVLLGAVGVTVFSDEVYAQIKAVSYDIASFLGIKEDLEPYTTAVKKSVTKGDLTVTLNEVILDRDELVVSVTERSEKGFPTTESEVMAGLDVRVFMNGREMTSGASGGSRKVDEHTIEQVTSCDVRDLDLDKEYDVELVFSPIQEEAVQEDTWKFAFSTSGRELAQDTREVPLDTSFRLPDGSVISLDTYTSNNLGQKIYFTSDGERIEYDLLFKGEDDLGNPVSFTLSRTQGNTGRMNIDTLSGGLAKEAKTLTLTPYAVAFPKESGKMSNDFQPVGDAFNITLP